MVLISTETCNNALEAKKQDRTHIEELNAKLDSRIPGRTSQERYEINKENILESRKQYYEHNKDNECISTPKTTL